MKTRKIKRLLAAVLSVAVLAGLLVYVAAQGSEPTVIFDAAAKTFSFQNVDTDSATGYPDLFTNIKNMMPGDSVTQTIKVQVKNAGRDTVKLMLKGEYADESYKTLTTLTDNVPYPATLTASFEGSQYSGILKNLGADPTASNAEGVYLGAFSGSASEKTVTVDFSLPIEAGNELQGLTAKLGWVFTAEIIPHSGGGGGGGGGGGTDIPEEPVPGADLNVTDHFAYIIGRRDGNIHPEAQITRGEVATIFFRMLTDDSRTAMWSTRNAYSDVAPNLWCNNAISTLSNGGILKGYQDGTFRADASITRAEFATMAVRFFQVTYNGPDLFSDISGHWACDYINRAAAAGIIKGYADGTFGPNQNITRAQAITIINRVLQRHPDKDHLLAGMITWPDNLDASAWYYADVQEATNSHDFDMKTNTAGEEYEIWSKLQPVRDWAAFENEWATANSAANPGEIISSSAKK